MKIPNTIKIGAHEIKVVQCDDDALAGEHLGLCDAFNSQIKLLKRLPPTLKGETLLHEIFEYLNIALELKMEHNVIQSFSYNLYQVLHDNELKF